MNLWEIEVSSDLFATCHPEDGSPMDGEVFYVTATGPDGRRFAHNRRFVAEFSSQRQAAIVAVEQLAQKIRAASTWKGPESNPHWIEIQPAYGSQAYAANWREYALDDKQWA